MKAKRQQQQSAQSERKSPLVLQGVINVFFILHHKIELFFGWISGFHKNPRISLSQYH